MGDGGNHLQYTRRLEPFLFYVRREIDSLLRRRLAGNAIGVGK